MKIRLARKHSLRLNAHLLKEVDNYLIVILHPKLEAIRRNDYPAVFFFEEWFKENHD
ncbi:hypothetical protein NW112_10745 [Staphylococcus pettenkoferi]|uniref:Uncharacterized protein n=1 Tax=Staphylococcus pettenkoferi TaxID=170573 RepID=A0A9Q4DB58_9STAP|nr:hypothetical protein [Staphylococcus pettenkoferi]